jgi:hypothetical protein
MDRHRDAHNYLFDLNLVQTSAKMVNFASIGTLEIGMATN